MLLIRKLLSWKMVLFTLKELIFYYDHWDSAGWQDLAGANMAMKPFVKRVITIFATNASFLRVISNFRI